MSKLFCFMIFGLISSSNGLASIQVPNAGNCAEDTVLTCDDTGNVGSIRWYGLGRNIMSNGTSIRPADQKKYTESKGILTIHNTSITDEGDYRCGDNFNDSLPKRLNIECKASSAIHSVTRGKKLQLTVDKLYPASPTFNVTFERQNIVIDISGSRRCARSTHYSGYYRCVWKSSNSLHDGIYSYKLVVTTITQSNPLTGSFKIATPGSPFISNSKNFNASSEVLYGIEGHSLTIQCTSNGGYPVQTVTWYKSNISTTNMLDTRSIGTLQSDGIYTVTLQQTFTPVASDDRKSFICRSYYRYADSAQVGSKYKSVILYLCSKPSQPTVTQASVISAGGDVTVRCTTTGSRPAAIITWLYQGVKYNGSTTSTINPTTETFTVISTYTRQVSATDNGQNIQCIVKHPALVSPTDELNESMNLSVLYPPSIKPMSDVTVIEGYDSEFVCIATSKPASTFKWYRQGQNNYVLNQGNGTLSSNKLSYRIENVRRTDDATYTCTANNGIENAKSENVKLTVYYAPDVSVTTTNTTVKAHTAFITCNSNGVPSRYMYNKWIQTWPGHSIPLSERPGSESLQLTNLTYQHSGIYTCAVSNGIKVFGTNKSFIEGSVNVLIKSFPIITKFNGKITAKLNEKLNTEIEYYSNTGESEVKLYQYIEGSIPKVPDYSLSETSQVIDLPVFTQTIKANGVKATLSFTIKSKEDIGYFKIVVLNEVGSSVRSVEVIPKGVPAVPYNISVDNIQQSTARVSWQPGYHWGSAQTFVIQLSTDGTQWENVETVYDGKDESNGRKYKTLKHLNHSTTYFVRIYSFNSEGSSPFSQDENFTTFPTTGSPVGSSPVGGIIGGTVAAVVVIVVLIVAVVLVRRQTITRGGIRTWFQELLRKQNRQKLVQHTEMNMYSQDNIPGQGASNTNAQNEVDAKNNHVNLYEKLQRDNETTSTNDVYAILRDKKEAVVGRKPDYENLPRH